MAKRATVDAGIPTWRNWSTAWLVVDNANTLRPDPEAAATAAARVVVLPYPAGEINARSAAPGPPRPRTAAT